MSLYFIKETEMSIFLIKSLLSIPLFALTLFAMFTMFEVFGRTEKKFNIEKLKKIHQITGGLYVFLYLVIAYLCLDFIVNTRAELSPRGVFHSVFALTIIILLLLKILFIRIYRQFYNQAKTIGLLMALITFGMIGTSAGHYLLVTKFGTDLYSMQKTVVENMTAKNAIIIKTDIKSIEKGKDLFNSKCYFCHNPHTEWITGLGLKNIMKNPILPVSKRYSTPENVANQIIYPYRDMPSFSYMSEDEILNLIAYLNTL